MEINSPGNARHDGGSELGRQTRVPDRLTEFNAQTGQSIAIRQLEHVTGDVVPGDDVAAQVIPVLLQVGVGYCLYVSSVPLL
jgi:hypothetical protein